MHGRSERRTLPTPGLLALIAAFWLVPQVVALFAVPGVATGPSYGSVRAALQWEVVPDAGGAVIALWAIVWLGWVDLVRHERFRTRRWVAVVPVVMVGAAVGATDLGRLDDAGAGLVTVLVVGTFFTGVSEELMFRGITLQAMRDRHREWLAAALSSLLFGALHLANIVVAGPGAIIQAFWATGLGYLLYLCRRVGGGMALPIVVHWVWDISSFSPVLGRDDEVIETKAFALFLMTLALLAVVAVRRRSVPTSPPPTGPTSGVAGGGAQK
ncbi:MAG: CPBP family intramembrane glutamic endopeptidase [Actinomycetota bacterium]|nr:CPBP family intramembrane glutamic endopeptidase [Actinomycetota bacterium]